MKGNNHSFYIDRRKDSILLNGVWEFTYAPTVQEAKEKGFRNRTQLPCSVYKSMECAGLLPPYYYGDNSKLYRHLRRQCFLYRRTFAVPEKFQEKQAFLCFDGADYETAVYLNGVCLGTHYGLCGGPYLRVEQCLRYGGAALNEIVLVTKSAALYEEGFEPWNDHLSNTAILPWGLAGDNRCSNGNFFLQGINGDIRLEFTEPVHLSRPFLTTVSVENNLAELHFSAELTREGLDETAISRGRSDEYCSLSRSNYGTIPYHEKHRYKIEMELQDAYGYTIKKSFFVTPYDTGRMDEQERYAECQYIEENVIIKNPVLWWPKTMGEPHLYQVTVCLLKRGKILDTHRFTHGIRTLSWSYPQAQKQYYDWQPYQLAVNGKKEFLRGINTIPFDYLLDREPDRERRLLELVRDANMTMIRLWGAAGVYASDRFYELCDQLGILVWQDSITANVPCPGWDFGLLATLVSTNVYRIRRHPSLAVYCGGNEINPYAPGFSAALGVIRQTTERLDSTRRFFETTPLGGSAHIYIDAEPSNFRKRYADLPFLGEAGVHCFPSFESLKRELPPEEIQGSVDGLSVAWQENHPGLMCHFVENNAERVPQLLKRTKQFTDVKAGDLHAVCLASQLAAMEYDQVLCEAMTENFPKTAGAFPWVLTRAWNTVGAQLVDKHTQPLLPYYAVKNAFAPLSPRICLREMSYAPSETVQLEGRLINYSGSNYGRVRLALTIYDPQLTEFYHAEAETTADEYQKTVSLGSFVVPSVWGDCFFFLFVRLMTETGDCIDRIYQPKCIAEFCNPEKQREFRNGREPNFDWEERIPLDCQLKSCQTELSAVWEQNVLVLENCGKYPAYPVLLESSTEEPIYPENNGFFLPRGETIRILFSKQPIQLIISGYNFESITLREGGTAGTRAKC